MNPKEFVPTTILLTDNKPLQCRNIVWAQEATADYMPNYTDLRFPYKQSSLLCPCCGKPLTGKPREIQSQEDPEDKNPKKDKKQKKPWEIHLEDVNHENPEDGKNCSLQKIQSLPHGKTMVLIEACHQITWMRALQERSSHNEGPLQEKEISSALLKKGKIPKMIQSVTEEFQDNPRKEELF